MNRSTRRLVGTVAAPAVAAAVATGRVDLAPALNAAVDLAVRLAAAAGWALDQLPGGAL